MIIENLDNKKLEGYINVPGDKSISHRAVMIGSIADGETEIKGFLDGDDCNNTIKCMKNLGVKIDRNDNKIIIQGKGLNGLEKPENELYVGNSGTTIRLLSGILAGQTFSSSLTGDESIKRRPMGRIIKPLRKMGSDIYAENQDKYPPINIKGKKIKGITYNSPIASAQVKSCVLLASLYCENKTIFSEPYKSRNHTELMLNYFGANIKEDDRNIVSSPVKSLYGKKVIVPGDISSAAFFIVGALILDNSNIYIKNVGINPTRTGIIEVLKKMGGQILIKNKRVINNELVADINVKSSKLKGISIGGEIIPKIIDEIPILSVAATFANAQTTINDAEELKVKESNRLNTTAEFLNKMGADVKEKPDGLIINPVPKLIGTKVNCYNDHRIAMAAAIATLKSESATKLQGYECVEVSFPNFFDILNNKLTHIN